MTHELKILPKYFQAIWDGAKTFELRKDDRDYQTADRMILREWEDGKFTGSMLVVIITYVLRNCPEYGLKDGYCILGIKRLGFGEGAVGHRLGERDFLLLRLGGITHDWLF